MEPVKYQISCCIVCRNALHELSHTLLKNIQDNAGYDRLEFVILDYNSTDGTEHWIKENFSSFILSGRLVYYKTFEKAYSQPHSKNVVLKLSKGEIICSIDTNTHLGLGFASYVNDEFLKNKAIVLNDEVKTLCVMKNSILTLRGFDEQIDDDPGNQYFINNLKSINISRVSINYPSHRNTRKNRTYPSQSDKLPAVFINYHTSSVSELILLYNDHHYKKGTLISLNKTDLNGYLERKNDENTDQTAYTIQQPGWEIGSWKDTADHSNLFSPRYGDDYIFLQRYKPFRLLIDGNNGTHFYHFTEQNVIRDLLIFNTFFYPDVLMQEKLVKSSLNNPLGYGGSTVFKNFNWELPLII